MNVFTLSQLNLLLVNNLHKIQTLPFDIIVHLPRSGTIPASLLATYIRKPLASVDEYCADIIITRKSEFQSLKRILLVDDSIRTGIQMSQAIAKIKKVKPETEISILAVFSTPCKDRLVQPSLALLEHIDDNYIYPWFMWKTRKIANCAVDMDGVLCRDCTKDEDDEGANYSQFLDNAEIKFKPGFPIGWIVTSRLEKYRPQTEAWLLKHGIKYNNLIMGCWNSNRDRKGNAADWKASIYRRLPATLFIESSHKESLIIHAISDKKVWCVDTQEAFGC